MPPSHLVPAGRPDPAPSPPRAAHERAAPGPRPRRRPRGALAAVLGLCTLALLTLGACTPEQTTIAEAINDHRAAHGLGPLLPSPHAMDKAQDWAEHLASLGRLEHSRLSDGMPDGWHRLAENVGHGSSIEAIHASFLASPAHRAKMLDPALNWMGTGHAVAADGTVYVVHIYARY